MRNKAPYYSIGLCMFLPCVIAIILFIILPDSIPAHISNGVIDRYGSKAEVFIIPIVNLLLLFAFAGVFKVLSKHAARNQSVIQFKHYRGAFVMIGIVFMALCFWYFAWLYGAVFN